MEYRQAESICPEQSLMRPSKRPLTGLQVTRSACAQSRERTLTDERNYVFERAELSPDAKCIGYRPLFNFRKTANIREKFVDTIPVFPDTSGDPTPSHA
jgi:hypothetical protein